MYINKQVIILILFLQIFSTSRNLSANQMLGQDKLVFKQAVEVIKLNNWTLARSLLTGLHDQLPNNIVISNNLAVVLFNLGELEQAQKLFSSIIEQNKLTATSYKNLKKLYSFSAAKTYSNGLRLLQPITVPEMLVLNENLDSSLISLSGNSSSAVNGSKLAQLELPVKQQSKINMPTKPKTAVAENTPLPATKTSEESEQVKNTSKQVKTSASSLLLERLEKWRSSWESGNVNQYISMYKKNYSPQGKSRNAWVKNRKLRVSKNNKISLSIENPKVYVDTSRSKSNIRFDQKYQSKNYSDKVLKRLYWTVEDGKWVIEKESIIKMM